MFELLVFEEPDPEADSSCRRLKDSGVIDDSDSGISLGQPWSASTLGFWQLAFHAHDSLGPHSFLVVILLKR